MTHAHAPLSVEGCRRFIERCKTRPIAHVAAEMGISRACASKWVNRWRKHGDTGPARPVLDAPPSDERDQRRHHTANRGDATGAQVADVTDHIRTNDTGVMVSGRTVTRLLTHLGLNRGRFIAPDGDTNRKPKTIVVWAFAWSGPQARGKGWTRDWKAPPAGLP
jgi:transposase